MALHLHGHDSPTDFSLESRPAPLAMHWRCPSRKEIATHCNLIDRTEAAAERVAMAVLAQQGLIVVSRAYHGSGADWLALRADDVGEFLATGILEQSIMVEISGIDALPDANAAERRVQGKVEQVVAGMERAKKKSPYRAVVVVLKECHVCLRRSGP